MHYLEQCQVGPWGSTVQNAGPQEAAAEVDNVLYVLPVCLHMSCDWSLLSRDNPTLLWLPVDSMESLATAISV